MTEKERASMIPPARRNLRGLRLALGITSLLFHGCGDDVGRYKPPAATAREALDATLAAWKEGVTQDAFAAKTPNIRPVDSHWRNGRTLSSYDVVKEEPGEADWRFIVRTAEHDPGAKAKSTDSGQDVTYIVFGHEPVWVYRDEDYTRLLNMDDNPTPARKSARAGGRSR